MLIKNCMLIDGADIFEEMKDIRIVNGKIKEVADCLMPEGDEAVSYTHLTLPTNRMV